MTAHPLNHYLIKIIPEKILQIANSNYNLRNKGKLKIHNVNIFSFGTVALVFLGPKILDNLPNYLKSLNSLDEFKHNEDYMQNKATPVDYAKIKFSKLVSFGKII